METFDGFFREWFKNQELSSLQKQALVKINKKKIELKDFLKIGDLCPFLIDIWKWFLKHFQPDLKMYFLLVFNLIRQCML